MIKLNQLPLKLKSWISQAYKIPKNIDFSLLRISPINSPFSQKEQFIPLARSTIIRKLSQDNNHVTKINQSLFEDFCRYLDACITNRNFFFLKEIKTGYEHLNPDVEVLSGGVRWTISRRQILDDEFWFMQKLGRLFELANFKEMNQSDLARWLKKHGGYSSVQVFIDTNKYEMLKVWLLGRENSSGKNLVNMIVDKYFPFLSFVNNPFVEGDNYRWCSSLFGEMRVAIAVRSKNSNKIELKMFKDISEGELIHTMPQVEICKSKFDQNILLSTSAMLAIGLGTHWMLPVASIDSGWLLASSHQLATSLAILSGGVGFLNWHVIQQKKSNYWKWRSDLNYRSIVANNRGVISLLGDRAQDEIFKESILAYVNILNNPNGISQRQLELDVKTWAKENCSPDFKETSANIEVNLTEALSLLRQLNIVSLDQSTEKLTAKSLELSTGILGTEFSTNNLSLELDGNTVIRNDSNNVLVAEPIAEGYEKSNRNVKMTSE